MVQLSPSDIQYQLEHSHESRVHVLLVSQIICFVLAVTAVILRLVSRRLIKAPIQSDDYMILMALVTKKPSQFPCLRMMLTYLNTNYSDDWHRHLPRDF